GRAVPGRSCRRAARAPWRGTSCGPGRGLPAHETAHVADVADAALGERVDGRARDLGGELTHRVEPTRLLAAGVDRARARAVEQSRCDGALDHVARDDDEA